MDSCLFYKSFGYAAKAFPDEYRLEFYDYLFDCCFFDLPIDEVPFPYRPVIIQMFASVSSAKDRHEKAVENGAKGGEKGGRPKKWIEREEAEALYAELKNWKAVADALEVDEDTLRKARMAWSQKAEKPKNRKNLNVNVNDNDNDNANDNVNVIINNNKNTGSNGETSKVPVLPELKPGECWTSEPMKVRNTGQWAAYYKTADGEERCMVFGEPT